MLSALVTSTTHFCACVEIYDCLTPRRSDTDAMIATPNHRFRLGTSLQWLEATGPRIPRMRPRLSFAFVLARLPVGSLYL